MTDDERYEIACPIIDQAIADMVDKGITRPAALGQLLMAVAAYMAVDSSVDKMKAALRSVEKMVVDACQNVPIDNA